MSDFETKNAVDGTILRGRIWAADTPKAVMSLVHGFGEHCGRYADMAAHLNAQGISVIALDLRGHGRSDGARGYCADYDLLLGDIDALLSRTRADYPALPHSLYGHSMGGGLVLNYRLKSPSADIGCVIASAPFIAPADRISGVQRILVKCLGKIAPKISLGNKIDGSKISRLPAQQELYLSDPLNHGALGVGLAIGMVEGGEWISENAKNWTTPLLLVHARDDQLTRFESSETFAKTAENCRFIAYENCEHEIHNDTPRADVYAEMTAFIKAQI